MADLGMSFNAETVEPSSPRVLLPAGDYKVQIINSEMKPTKDGEGQFLWLEMDILDGEFVGKKVYDRLNLINRSQDAADIAQRTLSQICRAVGVMKISNSEPLHFKPMIATVGVQAGRTVNGKTYDPSNQVKGYAPAPASTAPAAGPAGRGAPWRQ